MRDASLPHLTAIRLLAWWKEVSSGETDLPRRWTTIVRRLGFAVATFHASAHPGTLGYLEPGEDLIFLRAGLPELVRRFTLAHELGHALMHRPSAALGDIQLLDGYETRPAPRLISTPHQGTGIWVTRRCVQGRHIAPARVVRRRQISSLPNSCSRRIWSARHILSAKQ